MSTRPIYHTEPSPANAASSLVFPELKAAEPEQRSIAQTEQQA